MRFRSGYKYQLAENEVFTTEICPSKAIKTEFLTLSRLGTLIISKGYAWDGPSGPTFDTDTFMRGSLAHDALYQLMRQELLDQRYRLDADAELIRICKEDGMGAFRRWYVKLSLNKLGAAAASPDNVKQVFDVE